MKLLMMLKKRIMPIAISAMMAVAMLPGTVFADDNSGIGDSSADTGTTVVGAGSGKSIEDLNIALMSDVTVDNGMLAEDIQTAVNENDTISFAAGTYTGLTLSVSGTKTFIMNGEVVLDGQNNNKPGISIKDDATLTIGGGEGTSLKVTGYSDGINVTGHDFTLNVNERSTLKLDENVAADDKNHGAGMWLSGKKEYSINIGKDATFTADGNTGSGVEMCGGSGTVQTDLATFNFEGCKYVSLSNNIKGSGLQAGTMETGFGLVVNFTDCNVVNMDNNGWNAICFGKYASGYLTVKDCLSVSMCNNNGWGTNGGKKIVIDNSNVDISHNAYQLADKGTVYPNVYATCSNLYCTDLVIRNNSNVKADDAGCAYGIWTLGDCTIEDSYVQANGNGFENLGKTLENRKAQGGHGIYVYENFNVSNSELVTNNNSRSGIFSIAYTGLGASNITNSFDKTKITSNGNCIIPDDSVATVSEIGTYKGYGMYFYPIIDGSSDYEGAFVSFTNCDINLSGNYYAGIYLAAGADINTSKIITSDNGKLGIATSKKPQFVGGIAIRQNVNVNDSYISCEEDGIGYGLTGYKGEDSAKLTINGTSVGKLNAGYLEATSVNNSNVTSLETDYVYMLSGSLQGSRDNMNLGSEYIYNGMTKGNVNVDDNVSLYSAPINAIGTMLTRFNLHKSLNNEAKDDTNTITVYDPNGTVEGDNDTTKYDYTFRYNEDGEDLEAGVSGNAYIWTPVTVVSYDATEGDIDSSKMGTAVTGEAALTNTRGDATSIGNTPVVEEGNSYVDATDYTICGNSLQLSEGALPSAIRSNYAFAGWYYVSKENEAKAAELAAAGTKESYEELYKLFEGEFTPATATNIFANDLNGVIVYAKWTQGLIQGVAFNDTTRDNSYASNDSLLAGSVITLQKQSIGEAGNSVWTQVGESITTGNDGAYKFDNLAPGTYRVVATRPNSMNNNCSIGYTADNTLGNRFSLVDGIYVTDAFEVAGGSYTANAGFYYQSSGGGGGGGGGTTTPITEPDVPLAELNKEDHFAYVIGYPEGDVRPAGDITRAEVATIFFRMLTDDSRNEIWSTANNYSDVKTADWFNNAVSTLSNDNILKGYEDGTFGANLNITRAEFAAIAARFDETATNPDATFFSDVSGHWAEASINRAAALGYIQGYEDGTFKPNQYITRAEAMTLINRVLGRDTVTNEGLLEDYMIKWPDNTTDKWYYTAVQEATNSHYYELNDSSNEAWTEMREVRDWEAFEKEWSNANSAANPGEVAGGSSAAAADTNGTDTANK